MMEKNAKIYVAGHRGMVGSACVRKFEREGYTGILKRVQRVISVAELIIHKIAAL